MRSIFCKNRVIWIIFIELINKKSIYKLKRRILNSLLLLIVFIAAIICAFFFEENYRFIVREIFKWSTNNNISFFGKNFHFFPSNNFLFSFGFHIGFFFYSLKNLSTNKKMQQIALLICFFFATTFLFSFVYSSLKIMESTACDDGKLRMNYNQINYDLIFVSSLIISLIPIIILKIKNSRIRG